jgi:glutamine synthetase
MVKTSANAHIVCPEGKEKEWDAYRTHVSKWETDRYLVMY